MSVPSLTVVVLNDYVHVNGGASRVAVDEAVALAEAGLRVIFVGASGAPCRELVESGAEIVALDQPELINVGASPGVALQGLWNRKAARAVAEVLAGLDPARTIVHLHGYTKALTTAPVRVANGRGFTVVCTLHDFFTACPNGAFFDYRANVPCTRQGLSAACITTNCDKRHALHKFYRVARSAVQRWPGRLPSGVKHYIALSRFSAGLLRPYLPADAEIAFLENIIPAIRQEPVAVAENRNLTVVGRLDREKGALLLLAAAERLGLTLTFVGEGPLRPEIEATGRHRVTGWLDAAGVQAELERTRCLVFPSLWYETYGLVVAEAAARGVPALVSDVSAPAERINHGTDGLIFESGNLDALCAGLARTTDGPFMGCLGRAAYDRFWAAPPTRDAHVRGLLDIYSAVLAMPQRLRARSGEHPRFEVGT